MPAITSALPHRCLPSRAFPFREAVPASPRGLAPLSFPGKRQRDFEALFRSEVRHSDGSCPNPTARCSPGLPHLEPHPNATPSACPSEQAAMRGAKDPCEHGPNRWPSPRRQCHQCPKAGHTVCAGEEERGGITAAPRHQDQDRLRTIEVVSSPVSPLEGRSSSESNPRRPASPSDIRQHDPPEGEPTAATSEVSWISRPVAGPPRLMTAQAIRSRLLSCVPSGRQPPSRGSTCVDGLIGRRSVTRGRAIGAGPPHRRGKGRFLRTSIQAVRGAVARISAL